ncbi:MAG: orotidine-5'-phosphate decarboxylase, partial [Nitrospinae bacterium]|nr:orotidine-5'-phosphate decarboxylase [Nitrospinota bacterium]
ERYVRLLGDMVGCFKVGLELFIKEGPDILQMVRDNSSASIFLDLKLHDIPATVRAALRSASTHGVRFITVHGGDGESILKTAAEVREAGIQVLAITVLTSLPESELPRLGYREGLTLNQLVLDRAGMAQKAGCAGVVCSGEEVAAIKKNCGLDFKAVVPGIRPSWSKVKADDQSRVVTPEEAIARGADLIVVGRPVRDAKDPAEAARKIVDEIASALVS